MMKLRENHIKTKLFKGFSPILNLGLIFENFDHKVPKNSFFEQKLTFLHFLFKMFNKKPRAKI